MAEAIALYHRDGRESGVFYCSDCRAVFSSREQAANCHGDRFCACGKKIERRFYAICDECHRRKLNEEEAAKEAARFEKASKIIESEYKGEMVFLDDHYYNDVEEAIDQFPEGQEPEYVWACVDKGVPLANSGSIVDHLLENMWEDAESSDIPGLPDLDEAIRKFNEANRAIHVYFPDYSTAILVPRKASQ